MMTEELLQDLIQCQRETNRWLRVLALPVLGEALRSALRTVRERRIYQESDGRTSRDVGAASDVTHPTVLAYWARWVRAGLVDEVPGAEGRYRRLVDLSDVGISMEEDSSG
jgi:hypothetical protein